MKFKTLLSKRYALFYILLAILVSHVAILNILLNQKIVQKRFARELRERASIDLDFDDITLQIFTGTLSGDKIALYLQKNGLGLSLKKFRIHFNPLFFLLGRIKLNMVMAEEIYLDMSDFKKPEETASKKPLPAFLRNIQLDRAEIKKFTLDRGDKGRLDVGELNIKSRFGSVITKSPTVMQIRDLKYQSPKLDLFVTELTQDGFFIFDLAQPRILDESRLTSHVEIRDLLMSLKKRKKPWLTNRGWDLDLEPAIKKFYGDTIPNDRSYMQLDEIRFDVAKNKLNTLIQSFKLKLKDGVLAASGQWNHLSHNFNFQLEAKNLPVSKLPLGQSQIRTAFDRVSLNLNARGTAQNLKNHNLNLTLGGTLAGNLVHPPAGDIALSAGGWLKNTLLQLSSFKFVLAQGHLTGQGSLDLAKLTSQASFAFDNFDIQTVLRLFSTQNISSIARGTGTVSGKVTVPKIQIEMNSEDAMYEFLHFGPARASLTIDNNNLKLAVATTTGSIGTSQLDLSALNVFDPFTNQLTLKSTHQNIEIQKLLNAQSLAGTLSGDFNLMRKNAIVSATGDFVTRDFIFFGQPIGEISSKLNLNRKHLNVSPVVIDMIEPKMTLTFSQGPEFDFDDTGYRFSTQPIPELKISGNFKKSQRDRLDLEFAMQNMPLKIFSALLPLRVTESSLSGRLKANYNIYAPLDSRFNAQFSKLEASNNEGALELLRPGNIDYAGRAYLFRNFSVGLGLGQFTLDGALGLEKNSNLKIRGKVDFNLISDFNPLIAESDNPIELDLTLRGELGKPQLFGKAILNNDTVVFRKTPGDFEEMKGTIFFDGMRLRFENVSFLYDDSPMEVAGWITSDYEFITAADLKLKGHEVPIHLHNGLNALADLDLKLSGSSPMRLAGSVNIVDGQFVREFGLNNFILKPVEEEDDEEKAFGLIPPHTVLDLNVKNTGDFLVKSSVAKLEMNADLDVGGTIANPLMDGQIDILGGEINAFGVDFEDATGYIQYRKRFGNNPEINLTAKKEIQEYEVLARISGQLENMKLRLSSTPSLDRREILSVLFYGQTPDQLVGEKRRQFTQTAAVTQLANVLSKPIYKISGLDVVEVRSRQERANQTVQRLSVGKSLSKRFNLNFTTDLGIEDPERAFELQYQVFDNFYFITAKDIGDRNRYRLDLSFRLEAE